MPDQISIQSTQKETYITSKSLWFLALILFALVCGLSLLYFRPILVLGVVSILSLVVILFYYPYVGVLAYLVFEYARISAMFPVLQPLQIGKLIVISTVVIWLFRCIMTRKLKFVSDKITWLMFLWLGLALGSSFFATDSELAFIAILDFARWVIIYFLIINLVDSLPKWQVFLWLLLLLNFKMSQFQIRQFVAGYAMSPNPELFIARGMGAGSTGFFTNAGDFGVAMCVVAPLAFYLIKAVRSKVLKVGGIIFFSAFAYSILNCGSRGAALSLFVMVFFFWLRTSRKFQSGVLLLLFLIGFWASAPEAWRERFTSTLNYEQDATTFRRFKLWEAGLKMSIDNQLLGVGINNFNTNYAARYHAPGEAGVPLAPHNIFIQAGSELGLPGFLSLLLVIFLVFKRNHQTRRLYSQNNLKNDWIANFAHALDLSLIGYIVSGSFLSVLYYPHLYIIMTLAISLNQIARKQVIAEKNLIEDDKK